MINKRTNKFKNDKIEIEEVENIKVQAIPKECMCFGMFFHPIANCKITFCEFLYAYEKWCCSLGSSWGSIGKRSHHMNFIH